MQGLLTGKRSIREELITVLILYIMLMAFFGYRFGDEDMMESLSYANYLLDPSLYPHDLYIQAVTTSNWNERFIFATLLSWGGENPAWYCYLIHLISSCAFIWASLLIAKKYLSNKFLQIVFLLIFLFAAYYINLGENEAWYNYLMPSHLAKSFAIWAIYLFLSRRENYAFLFLIPATFCHPIVGAQLALLFALVQVAAWIRDPQNRWHTIGGIMAYGLTAGLWVMIIFYHHLVADQTVSDAVFYEIMETRLAHHWFPSYYPLKHWIILVPIMVYAAYFWRNVEHRLFEIYLYCGIGMVIYLIGIEYLEITQLLSLQWFKTTVWLKPLSILALCIWLEQRGVLDAFTDRPANLALIIGGSLAITQFAWQFPAGPKHYHFPFSQYESDEIHLANILRRELANDAVLLVPPHLTATRYYAKRSLYIDYKSNIHSRSYMAEAARRREDVYGMKLAWRQSGKNMVAEGRQYFHQLSDAQISAFKKEGVTHYVQEKKYGRRDLRAVVENQSFIVYEL